MSVYRENDKENTSEDVETKDMPYRMLVWWLNEHKSEFKFAAWAVLVFLFGMFAFSACGACINESDKTRAFNRIDEASCKEEAILIGDSPVACKHRAARLTETGKTSPGGGFIYVCACPRPEPIPEELTK